MGRIIAISSGDLYTTEAMNKYAIRMVTGATKRVLLREVYEKDTAVLMGISAGAMCWFDSGCTDSELAAIKPGRKFGFAEELLGIHPQTFCPHYEDRVEDFSELLKDKQTAALALESNVAFVEQNGAICFIKSVEEAKAYEFRYDNGRYEKKELEVKYIG